MTRPEDLVREFTRCDHGVPLDMSCARCAGPTRQQLWDAIRHAVEAHRLDAVSVEWSALDHEPTVGIGCLCNDNDGIYSPQDHAIHVGRAVQDAVEALLGMADG